MSDQYDYNNFEKNRKLFGDRTFVSQSAESQSDKERKYRNDDLGHNRKYDLLEFIKKTCNKFCLVPGSCKSYHDGENKCTHYRHDLRNRELKYNFRKFLQSVYVCNDRKVWNQCIAGSNREQSCTDGRNIGDNKSHTKHTGGTVTEFSDGRCDKSNDDQWYTEVDQLTKDVFQSYDNIQDSHSNGIGVGTA